MINYLKEIKENNSDFIYLKTMGIVENEIKLIRITLGIRTSNKEFIDICKRALESVKKGEFMVINKIVQLHGELSKKPFTEVLRVIKDDIKYHSGLCLYNDEKILEVINTSVEVIKRCYE